MALARIKSRVRLVVPAGKAKPSPAIGQTLGQLGINLMAFCKEFNEKTKHMVEEVPVRVKLTARVDNSYSFVCLPPQSTWFLKRAAGVEKGTHNPLELKVGSVHVKQIYELARLQQTYLPHMKALPLESIARSLVGTARTLGLTLRKD